MNIRSLLPIGRSFRASEDRPGRFQPAEPGFLPDFSRGSRADPGLARLTTEPAAGGGVEERRIEGDSGVAVPATGHRRLPLWLEQVILTLLRPGNRRRGSREERTDLRFRSVRVARNDLTTADVEVVTVKPPANGAPMSASCRGRLMALWWGPVARKLRRWGRTQV